jgi:hypothetical protein
MEISIQLHPEFAFSPRKELALPIGKEAGWVGPITLLDTLKKRKSHTMLAVEQ